MSLHPTWHVHLGAHKTATTHIQNHFADHRDALAQAGSFYLPLQDTRSILQFRDVPRPPLARLATKVGRRPTTLIQALSNPRFAARCADRLISEMEHKAGPTSRIILSEENIFGTLKRVFDGSYFKDAAAFPLLGQLARRRSVKVYVSIRALDSFLPSAYVQALRTIHADHLNLKSLLTAVTTDPPRWSKHLGTLADHLPETEIVVWDYADYSANETAIQSRIAGCDLPSANQITRPSSTQSPSAAAIALAEAEPEQDPMARPGLVADIYAAHPISASAPKFDPLSIQQKSLLQASFEQDLTQIADLSNAVVLRF